MSKIAIYKKSFLKGITMKTCEMENAENMIFSEKVYTVRLHFSKYTCTKYTGTVSKTFKTI